MQQPRTERINYWLCIDTCIVSITVWLGRDFSYLCLWRLSQQSLTKRDNQNCIYEIPPPIYLLCDFLHSFCPRVSLFSYTVTTEHCNLLCCLLAVTPIKKQIPIRTGLSVTLPAVCQETGTLVSGRPFTNMHGINRWMTKLNHIKLNNQGFDISHLAPKGFREGWPVLASPKITEAQKRCNLRRLMKSGLDLNWQNREERYFCLFVLI